MDVVVPEDAAEPADVVEYCDDKYAHDANNDARYDIHAHDAVQMDAVRRVVMVDGVVPVGVEAPGLIHIRLPED